SSCPALISVNSLVRFSPHSFILARSVSIVGLVLISSFIAFDTPCLNVKGYQPHPGSLAWLNLAYDNMKTAVQGNFTSGASRLPASALNSSSRWNPNRLANITPGKCPRSVLYLTTALL